MIKIIKRINDIDQQIAIENSKYSKRFWYKPRNLGFWEYTVSEQPDDVFIEHFRVDRETFNYIVDKVKTDMTTQDTNYRDATPVAKKVAVALNVLASNAEYLQIAAKFGIGKTSVHTYFKGFIKSAMKYIVPKHIIFPDKRKFEDIAEEFRSLWDYDMAVGAIDGCQFPCRVPKEHATDYYNYKGWHSVLCLAICDAHYKVYYLKAGLPGRCNDAGVFANTELYKMAENRNVFPDNVKLIEDTEVGYHLLGDGAFALKKWLMKPFTFNDNIPEDEKVFNYLLSRARRVIENTFGRVKGRWRRLSKELEVKLADVGEVITVAFALHNICEERRVHYNLAWNREIVSSTKLSQPNRNSRENICNKAKKIRDALKCHFYSKK